MDNTIPDASPTEQVQDLNGANNEQPQKEPIFYTLSPSDNADPNGHYSNMLQWALEHRLDKDIKNIALTGPYGSGKSSVLKTFEKKYTEKYSFLNISLATFKEEKGTKISNLKTKPREDSKTKEGSKIKDSTVKKDGEKLKQDIGSNEPDSKPEVSTELIKDESPAEKQAMLRLVEMSILQQIFYHEKDETIPDTRFKKARSFSDKAADALTDKVYVFFIALAFLFFSNELWGLLTIKPDRCISVSLNVIAIVAVLYYSYLFIRKTIKPLGNIHFKKINIKNAEFAMDDNISKSILNEHLDEILYFFEQTSYDVVIFEDLDRFEQTEIFTKLREINHLINYSKKINRRVVFIYSVRDDMFQDKDRTKFFDFIVPVIPVIDFANSASTLERILKENEFKVQSTLIDDVCLFIDDMRLLYNIVNEYNLYRRKQGQLNAQKLFAMVVYKNIYPKDFVKLCSKEGLLFEILSRKDTAIKKEEVSIDEALLEVDEKLNDLEKSKFESIEKLRQTYLFEILVRIGTDVSLHLNSKPIEPSELSSDENFKEITLNRLSYHSYIKSQNSVVASYRRSNEPTIVRFSDIERAIDPMQSYEEKEILAFARMNNKIDELRTERDHLLLQKEKINQLSIRSLVKKGSLEIDGKLSKQHQFIATMLRAGYIDDNYADFTSIFYPGSITEKERTFLLNLRSGEKNDPNTELVMIEPLLKKMRDHELGQEGAFNVKLLDYLLKNSQYQNKALKVLRAISEGGSNGLEFMDAYVTHGKEKQKFIKELVKVFPSIWSFITHNSSSLSPEKIDSCLKLIIENLESEDLKKMESNSSFALDISVMPDFFSKSNNPAKLKGVVQALDIKFQELDLSTLSADLIDFLYKGNHYALNPFMLSGVLASQGKKLDNFKTANYFSIKQSKAEELIKYVDGSINDYIENVWLQLPDNKNEKARCLIDLLNNREITIENKEIIIQRSETLINNLSEVSDIKCQENLLENSKVKPTWDNVLHYFQKNGQIIDDVLESFFSDVLNATALAEHSIAEKPGVENNIIEQKLAKGIFYDERIPLKCFALLADGINFTITTVEAVRKIRPERLEILIGKRRVNFTPDIFNVLKEISYEKFLHIKLGEVYRVELIDQMNSFTYDTKDALHFMISKKLTLEEKNVLVNKLLPADIIADEELLNAIAVTVSKANNFAVAKAVAEHIIRNDKLTEYRLSCLNRHFNLLSNSEVVALLETLPEPYSFLAYPNSLIILPANAYNTQLVKNLMGIDRVKEFKKIKKQLHVETSDLIM